MKRIENVYDANVYLNNDSKHGLAKEVVLPTVSYAFEAHEALGLIGTPEFPKRIEAMEATITWDYPDNEAQKALANPFKAVDIDVRSSRRIESSSGVIEEQPVLASIRGRCKSLPGGTFSAGANVESQTAIAVHYYRLEVDMEAIFEIDVINNRLIIGGVDVMAERRKNLGI